MIHPHTELRFINEKIGYGVCHFQNYLSRFENYLSSLAPVRKLDKAHQFLCLGFILSFLPKNWCPKATIQPSLRLGKNTRVSFTIPNAAIDHRIK
jgi:hypothetical protein